MFYNIHIDEERQMRYGLGLAKICDTTWRDEQIKTRVQNWKVMENIDGINGLHIIVRLDGTYYLNQFCGYNDNLGMFCYMVHEDGTITKEV